ncbi:hypothetical protein KQJ29_28085, partial [Enterococcus sp. S181_ASV_20]|nr:hypothetical protein [Enterococcus sp. S181_ASV_20]
TSSAASDVYKRQYECLVCQFLFLFKYFKKRFKIINFRIVTMQVCEFPVEKKKYHIVESAS